MKVPTVFILVLGVLYTFSGNSYSTPLSVTGQSGVVKYNKAKSFDGYNFYTNNKTYAYLMDMTGRIVHRWKFSNAKHECWHYARLLDNGDILGVRYAQFFAKFDKNSKLIWETAIAANHDIELLPDGTFLVPAYELPVKYDNRTIRFDSIVHISKDGQKLSAWSTYENLKELQKFHLPLYLDPNQNRDINLYPFYHLNSIQILPDTALGLKNKNFQKGNWLICLRDVDLILILDKDTHKVVWSWGPGELDRPHMPRMLNNGNILVYDNGMHRTYSRLVVVNPVSRKIVWEYKASPPENFHSKIEGSSQLLANGNFLICEATNGRAFEITPGGEIVWEFLNPEVGKNGRRMTIYRMLRIPKEEVSSWLGR